jgi:hypothetical protein
MIVSETDHRQISETPLPDLGVSCVLRMGCNPGLMVEDLRHQGNPSEGVLLFYTPDASPYYLQNYRW